MNTLSIQAKFGKTIALIRNEKGISQEALAHRCGFDRTYLSGIERGKRNLSIKNIDRLAYSLEMPISELFIQVEKSC